MGEDAVTGDIAADEEGDEIQIPLVMEEPSVEPLDVENEGNTGELETEASSPRDDILRTLLDSYLSREAKYDALMRLHNERLLLMWRGYKQSVDTVTQRQQTLAIRSPRSGPNVVPDSRRYRGYGIDLNDDNIAVTADSAVHLVPIRLDIEGPEDMPRLRDTFTWNLNETALKPEVFAKMLCDDLKLPYGTYGGDVVREIREQVQDHFQHFPPALKEPETPMGNNDTDDGSKDASELRLLIKLDITLNNYSLIDQFEWDLMCKRNSPEAFAEHMARELGLIDEFKTAIAHSIREQIQSFAKSLLLVDYQFQGGLIDDEELSAALIPAVDMYNVYRPPAEMDLYGPRFVSMPLYEFERIEKENQRDTRRKRRQTQRSRRATALPDREPLRTYRTPTGLVQNALNALEKRVVTQGQRIVPLEPAMEQTFQTIIERDARYNRFIMELAQAGKVLPVWMCMGCLKTSKDTFVIRRGPDPTQKSLCDECGLFFIRNHALPELPQSEDAPEEPPKFRIPSWYLSKIDFAVQQRQSRLGIKAKEPFAFHRGVAVSNDSEFNLDHPEDVPLWASSSQQTMSRKYPYDHFEIVTRKTQYGVEVKIQCFDCPGKLYQTGSGQSLSNFEFHLKNKSHRANVQRRIES